MASRVRGCSLDLHSGEVLGIAGLVGAGPHRTRAPHLRRGAAHARRGDSRRQERSTMRTPRDAIDAGLVYLTEDRKGQGLFLDMSVRDNINVAVAGRDARMGVLDLRARRGAGQATRSPR